MSPDTNTTKASLRLEGEWTIARAAELVATLERTPWRDGIHLDLTHVTRVDYTFLQILCMLRKSAASVALTDPAEVCRAAARKHGLSEIIDSLIQSPSP